LSAGPRSGEFAYIALQMDAQGKYSQVQSMYRWRGPEAQLIWQAQP